MIPVVAEDPAAPSSAAADGTGQLDTWFTGDRKVAHAPSWKNEVTLRSVEDVHRI